ncbi:MAG: LPS export ABC transporter permease LptF [Paracoccus sp. (in: a-proteobacteria)]|uniref:LPS export ABC transporter permease LptF n=1 Tax=Paracoccus sp. TaxID=267 RepID=UPI0026DECDBB|nr:LPS export ABC transporter permease LptF [Paracoccus sp. (in: a-proteobacteria)]MDO5621444.1 LPS export ABC transporter permease LptF [Paracoccus sp. (in: a-proteobacteria)]
MGTPLPFIDRYICSRLFSLFGFFALVLVSVYWINRAVSLFEQLLSDGQTALVVLEFTALTLPVVIGHVLPVAGFAAAAYAIQKLSGDSELVAMQAAGMSPWRLARPVLVFGLLVGLMVAVLVNALVPMSRTRLAERQNEIAENVTAQFLRPGSFQYPANGVTLFIRAIADDGRLLDVFIEDGRNPASQVTYTAEEALLQRTDTGPRLVMMRGMAQRLDRPGNAPPRLSVTRFADLTYDLGAMLNRATGGGRDLRGYSTWRLLSGDPTMLEATGATPAQARVEGHERLSRPLLAPVAVMLGFSMLMLGSFSRFGMWRQMTAAVVALILLYLADNAAASMAGRDPSRFAVLYLPAVAGALIAALVLWQAARPKGCPK